MPITLLHMGLMAPFFHWRRSWLALVSFTLVNLWIDLGAIMAVLGGTPLPSHDEAWHTMHGALLAAAAVSVLGILSWPWILGAVYGAVTHILLDGMVHPEMQPFVDTTSGNALYLGSQALAWLSALLVAPTIWLIALIVRSASGTLYRAGKRRGAPVPPSDQQSP